MSQDLNMRFTDLVVALTIGIDWDHLPEDPMQIVQMCCQAVEHGNRTVEDMETMLTDYIRECRNVIEDMRVRGFAPAIRDGTGVRAVPITCKFDDDPRHFSHGL